MEVYFEEFREGGVVAGRSFSNFLVQVDGGRELLGECRKVLITEPKRMVLNGKIVY